MSLRDDSEPTSPERAAASVLLPGFVGTTLPDWVAARLRDGLAGVCLFGSNISSRRQLRELTDAIRAANPRAVIAIDEEAGDVTRLYYDTGSPYPGAAILGRIDDIDLTREVGRTVGWDLTACGVNLNLAPDADVNSNPDNPVIGVRSFGTVSTDVARHVTAFTEGLQSTGVAACAKHFPGHGDTAEDSHLALPVVDRSLRELRDRELVPFVAAIDAGTRSVMTSHILLPQVDADNPATFSRSILGDLLRGELGFDGAIVSDALDMAGASAATGIPEAAVRALAAGCDLLCIGTGNTAAQLDEIEAAIADAVDTGRLERSRLDDAARRVVALVEASAANEPDRAEVTLDTEPEFSPVRSAGSFDIAAGVSRSDRIWPVKIATTANVAIGDVPWGPFAPVDGSESWGVAQDLHVGDELAAPPDGAQLWLVGRDNHRYDWVRRVIDDARSRFRDVVVVDMGWPSVDRAYADIATFGASRHAGDALRVREVPR